MDTQEKADLQHVMIKALSDSLNAQFAATEQEYRLARYNDRKKRARAKKVKLPVDKGWTEKYALNVRHFGTYSGRACTVSVDGCSRWIEITPNHLASWQKDAIQTWSVYMKWEDEKKNVHNARMDEISGGDNLESIIQQAIVAMMGHAYYDTGDAPGEKSGY